MGGSHRLNDLLQVTSKLVAESGLELWSSTPEFCELSQPVNEPVCGQVRAPEDTAQEETLAAGSGEAGEGGGWGWAGGWAATGHKPWA